MRPSVLAILVTTVLLISPSALAAPGCVDRNGGMRRCGIPGAMPVGWDISPDQRQARNAEMSVSLNLAELTGLICFIGGIFALIALLPDFDAGWDAQESDDEEGA